jgi:HK97 family phage portal protein
MAFNFFKWLLKKDEEASEELGTEVAVGDFLDMESETSMIGLEVYLSRMAFWSIVRKIGSAVAAVEWETYRRGKKVKAKEYWAWNHEPNPNQNRDEFFQSLIGALYSNQEALIVETRNGSRYVADGYNVTEKLTGNVYQNISVNGEEVPGVYLARDVLHFTIEGEKIKRVLLAIASAEGRLLKSSAARYLRSQGTRGILKIDDTAEADPDFDETYEDLVTEKFKKYFTSENAVLPLFNGYDFTERESTGGSSKSNIVGTRDIRNMMDDIVELTAQAFGVPVSIVTGKNVTDADFKAFMTYTVQPLVKMIASEINRKVYGRDLVFAGTYVAANLGGVRYNDLFDVANPIDKLIGSGAFCINDIRVRLGLDVIDEPWAWQHWMTKNYATVEDLLEGVAETQAPAAQPEKEVNENEQEETETDPDGGSGEE